MQGLIERYNAPENRLADCIRFLSHDAISSANSGHLGMPFGMADIVTVLYKEFLVFNPEDPSWQGRDRFVVSNGHGSMLLYSLMYLLGYYDINIDDIKSFRRIDSKCQGHPEYGAFLGIECSTGPLGQGLGNAVGMALSAKIESEKLLSQHCYKVYCTVGDGCLMEGVSQEVITFAAHYKLNNLVVIFDNNEISIDGKTSLSTSEDQSERFRAAGWEVLQIDGHDVGQIRNAISFASNSTIDRPIFIDAKTMIGFGLDGVSGTEKAHGFSDVEDQISAFKRAVSWDCEKFEVPDRFLKIWRKMWLRNQDLYRRSYSNDQQNFGKLKKIADVDFLKKSYLSLSTAEATRKALNRVLSDVKIEENCLYGSADLGGSVMIKTGKMQDITGASYRGDYINFGIREHGMATICNGIALSGKFTPFCSTFLAFSDYMKPAIRMSALMKKRVIYVFSHDSIGVGEDGATHQPVEHLTALRSVPGLHVFRPCDVVELLECLYMALELNSPSALVLSRQDLENFPRKIASNRLYEASNHSSKGGYVIYGFHANPQICLVSSGYEVSLAIEVAKRLEVDGLSLNVVSIPCNEVFEKQSESYISQTLAYSKLAVVIEFGDAVHLRMHFGKNHLFFGVREFGESGYYKDLMKKMGLDAETIASKIKLSIT